MISAVTGSNGFIGRNVAFRLMELGQSVILVDRDDSPHPDYENYSNLILGYLHHEVFLQEIHKLLHDGDVVYHQGGISSTKEKNLELLLKYNYEYTKELILKCASRGISVIYASSASVYGDSDSFDDESDDFFPLNLYGWSKLLVDKFARQEIKKNKNAQIVGFRYFNVYGPHESEKGSMASPVTKFANQIIREGKCVVFKTPGNATEPQRDFIFVKDLVEVLIWSFERAIPSGIYNLGSGTTNSFLDVARIVGKNIAESEIEIADFPSELLSGYQFYTCANNTKIKSLGWESGFSSLEYGIKQTINSLGYLK